MITQVNWGVINTPSESAADIANKTSSVNTVGKYAGLIVWDTTNHRLMRAEAALDVSPWWVVDGSVSVTPA